MEILSPRIAPQHIVILPITPKEESRDAVIASCHALAETLRHQMYHGDPLRMHVDTRDLNGGVKKWEWIKKRRAHPHQDRPARHRDV